MKTKYVKLFEEYIQESQLLTDPVAIKNWIDSWKDEIRETYVSKDGKWKEVPRLNGTYTIRPDGVVDVVGGVNLYGKELEIIPIQFGKVTEDFDCFGNNLITLQYCPTSVGGNFSCNGNPKLITHAHNSKIKGDFIRNGIEGTLEERILRYIEYLKPLDQQERDSSLDWLYSVEKDLHKEVMDYITKNNIDVISGRVKSIYNKTNTQNKRMPLL